MNRLLIASILALLSWGVSAQTWAMTDQTFERVYNEVPFGNNVSSEAVYRIVYNVSVPSTNMYGLVIMEEASSQEDLFFSVYDKEDIIECQMFGGVFYVRADNYEDTGLWRALGDASMLLVDKQLTITWGGSCINYVNTTN
jgi:hypothetical protein|tara:strand:+ start:2239 stop:2661 length:423 start_codon:yes stop_codon:yes gene_type:complete